MSSPSFQKTQPGSIDHSSPNALESQVATDKSSLHKRISSAKRKVTTKDGWFGDYDYAWLCIPPLPFGGKAPRRLPPFYSLDADLPLVLAFSSGLQHALAMLAGLITPPIIFASTLNLDSATSAYMISASLIGCGILSLVQISRIPLLGGYYLGTGLISVVGTSFATLSTANAIFDAMYRDGTCSSIVGSDGSVVRNACPDAYGKVLDVPCLHPPRVLKRIFPPLVTGTVVLLIGASLIGSSGVPNWGGGSNNCQTAPTGIFALCPSTLAPRPLPWGSPEFIGLGFLSFISIVLTELFGSPFLKNISIIVGLAVGCIVSGAAGYIDGSSISSAPAITFLWVHTFKISVYPPAILPISLAMEAIGDITASAECSRVDVRGIEFDSRVQGGVLSDGLGGFLSALFTVTPLSIFAQNNGVIAMTRCANRSAGRWCCAFLILFGILGKISGVFLAIPNPVIGGVTTFLFASVAVSGIRVLSLMEFTRRDRFVLAAALSFGIGDLLVPKIFTELFNGVNNPSTGLEGLLTSITIILSTPFLAAGIVAVIMNLVLPQEHDTQEENSDDIESSLDEQKEVAA
ncbi:xanthine/uracil permease [Lentinula guzmanii]|uniref:Xanthine/uracil permease n=1 Tax=Lentinula guzmanii TaxID=2804957 RepID=A0AA38N489_9AGAR|nr:xanthine/uracil permease [Lentinula guzmanii]